MSDSDLCDMAARLARECLDLAGGCWLKSIGEIRQRLARFVAGYGITPPALPYTTRAGKPGGVEDGPAISRMTDSQWWRRALRRHQARELERAAIGLGYVHRMGEIYASDATCKRREQQRRRNARVMESTTATNLDTGQEFNLGELAARSVANPRIRRGELMTRIAGFERVAADLGHAAEFVTLTCPSSYHVKRVTGDGKVEDNPKYSGATPREAQGYLARTWANIRAKLHRLGVRPYGFRIAEPHHDGCPHWHMLLFVPADARGQLREVIRDYALRVDGDEAGAAENRVEFVSIDTARGSAAGYIAKYVSKNIDGGGYEVQGDLEGMEKIVPAARVEAWASTWGIRQFQQVGGPPVGVWRELRRLEAGGEYSATVEAARLAADVGPDKEADAAEGWARYVRIMGGPGVERRNLPIRTAYTRAGERWDYANAVPYPAPLTRYGEQAGGVVYGVSDEVEGRVYPGRRYRWAIVRGSGLGADFSPPRTRVNNCSGWQGWRDRETRGAYESRSDGGIRGTGASLDGCGTGGVVAAWGGAVAEGRKGHHPGASGIDGGHGK
jgi:hypothetical protein